MTSPVRYEIQKVAVVGLPGAADDGRPAPVEGTFNADGLSGPFRPNAGQVFNVTISGDFVATLTLKRSFDGGVPKHELTAGGETIYVWTAPASERAEEGAPGVDYYLECSDFTSGPVSYRIS